MAETIKDQAMDSHVLEAVGTSTFGELLRAHRERCDMGLAEVARKSSFSTSVLERVEADQHDLTVDELAEVADCYDFTATAAALARAGLVLNIEKGSVALTWAWRQAAVADRAADRVFARYLHLLYADRDLPMGTPISIRDVDLKVLRGSLALRREDVIDQIGRMDVAEKRRGVPKSIMILSCAVALAGAVLVGRPDATPTPAPAPVEVEIGTAVSISRPPTDTGGAVVGDVATEIGSAVVIER